MTTLTAPSVTLNIEGLSPETSGVRTLFVGFMQPAGTATDQALVQNIGNDGEENTLFGQNSMLAEMIREFKSINKTSPVDAIPVEVPIGSSFQQFSFQLGSISATPFDVDGTLTLTVLSKKDYVFEFDFFAGESRADLFDRITTYLNAQTDIPFYSTFVSSPTDAIYSFLYIQKHNEAIKSGFIVEITENVHSVLQVSVPTAISSTPDLSNIFDVVSSTVRYQTIVWPSSEDITLPDTFLENRFNSSNDILDGIVVTSIQDTNTNLGTYLDATDSKNVVTFVFQTYASGGTGKKITDYKRWNGNSTFNAPYINSAHFAAQRALKLESGTVLTRQVLSTLTGMDTVGGTYMSSFPYFNWKHNEIESDVLNADFTNAEAEALQAKNASIVAYNKRNDVFVTGEVFTMDKTGNFKNLEYLDTYSAYRELVFNETKEYLANSRITSGALVYFTKIHGEESLKAFYTRLYAKAGGQDYVLVAAGVDAISDFRDNLVVSIDVDTRTVTVVQTIVLVTQLRNITGTIDLQFEI